MPGICRGDKAMRTISNAQRELTMTAIKAAESCKNVVNVVMKSMYADSLYI